MHSKRKLRVKLDRADRWRVVLTDTSPFEVPIIVSNDGFYKNLHGVAVGKSVHFKKMINALVLDDDGKSYSVPLRYNIVKDSRSIRTLSLLHPKSQVVLASFYQRYEELVCEYAARSPFSIRAPKKIGSSFFVPSTVEDLNRYKNTTVDTTELDGLVRNPASYFAYSGFSRLHQFFASGDHIRLEKKFRYQLSLDISKCFDSIYTHSIAWATKSKEEAKENIFALNFGNQFDKVMQRLNHNETSGICIGPEASRIFAEIILAKVDRNARRRLEIQGIHDGTDYDCRRYVDNYYVFANDPHKLEQVEHELSLALREYNLHLNTAKRELDKRPFYSKKSLVIDQINKSLNSHWAQLFEVVYLPESNKKALMPKYIYRYRSLFGKFTREIKAACYASELGYDAVANYVIGAVRRKVIDIADGYSELSAIDESPVVDRDYRQMFFLLLDIGFYFFTLHPTVASSLRLSHAVVRTAQHLQEHDIEGSDILKEASLRWASQLARAPSFEGLSKNSIVPIELLNILIGLQQFGGDGQLEHELISLTKLDKESHGYFELVVKYFIYRDHSEFDRQRNEIWQIVCERVASEKHLARDSETVHLLLDVLACPYIEKSKRAKLLRDTWQKMARNMGTISVAESEATVEEIQQQHWFVRWDGVDLLNMIEKKELSSVYA
ncbi:MAG: antiviral reverse transcriptase Drt3b [Roseibium sp.]